MTGRIIVSRKSVSYKWVIFGVLAAQYLFGYFHRVCPAVVAPELTKAFDISGVALGVLASAYFYPYAAMQIPAGMLSDSWGAKKTVMVCALIAALGSVLFGLSPTLGYAIFSRVLVGLGVSAMFVTSLKIFANWFKPTEFARMSALFMAAGGLGWLTAATPLAVFSQYFDWRWAFIGLGIITMLLTVLTRFTVSDRPDESDSKAVSERGKGPGTGARKIGQDLKMVLKEKYFWPLAIYMFLGGAGSFGFFSLWAGPYLMDVSSTVKACGRQCPFRSPSGHDFCRTFSWSSLRQGLSEQKEGPSGFFSGLHSMLVHNAPSPRLPLITLALCDFFSPGCNGDRSCSHRVHSLERTFCWRNGRHLNWGHKSFSLSRGCCCSTTHWVHP